MDLTIKYGYTPEDIDPLHELENMSFSRIFRWRREDLAKALERNDVWIGKVYGKIVGYVLSEVEGDTGHIVSIAVNPDYRGQGFGKSLLDVVECYHKKRGYKKMKLEVHTDNPAQTLYFKSGYRVTGIRWKYYANGSSALTMTKVLSKRETKA